MIELIEKEKKDIMVRYCIEKLKSITEKYPYDHPEHGMNQGGYHYVKTDFIAMEAEFGERIANEIGAFKPKEIVEIGTGHGYSTGWILVGMLMAGGGNLTTFDRTKLNWHFYDIPGNVKSYTMDFKAVNDELPEKIDFVLHDGSHTFELVKPDLDILLPRMSQEGKIWFHDAYDEISIPLKEYFFKKGWRYSWLKEASHFGFAARFDEKWSTLF
jgi:hypothetical protein